MKKEDRRSDLIPRRVPLWPGLAAAVAGGGILFLLQWLGCRGFVDLGLLPLHAIAVFCIATAIGECLSLSSRMQAVATIDFGRPKAEYLWAVTPVEDCLQRHETRHDQRDFERQIDECGADAVAALDDRWFLFYLAAYLLLFGGALIAIPQVMSSFHNEFPVFLLIAPAFYATIDATLLMVATLIASRTGRVMLRRWANLAKKQGARRKQSVADPGYRAPAEPRGVPVAGLAAALPQSPVLVPLVVSDAQLPSPVSIPPTPPGPGVPGALPGPPAGPLPRATEYVDVIDDKPRLPPDQGKAQWKVTTPPKPEPLPRASEFVDVVDDEPRLPADQGKAQWRDTAPPEPEPWPSAPPEDDYE